jgi:hypothetical protein
LYDVLEFKNENLNLIYNNGRFIDVLVFPLNKLNPEAKGWKQKKEEYLLMKLRR